MDIQRPIVAALVWTFVCGVASSALAQSDSAASEDKQGTSTVVLQFETSNVSQEIMDAFYLTLNEMIDADPEMHVVSGGEVTIEELSVTVGCDHSEPECLESFQNYVSADRMLFGTVQRSDDVHLFTLKLFDFGEGEFVHTLAERTVEGDRSTVEQAIPAVVESFLHGDVGSLEVTAQNADQARVYFDGEEMGTAPVQLDGLPLGQHAVTVETADGAEKTELVILRNDETETLGFEFDAPQPDPAAETRQPPVLGYSVAGAGLAGLVVGIVGSAQNAKFRNQASELRCAGGARTCSPSGEELTSEEVARRAEETDRKVTSSATMSAVGYSVAAAGLGVGGYLLYRHYSGASGPEQQPAVAETLRIAPSPEGVSVGLSLDF